MTEKQKSMTHRLVLMAMFVAVQIILSRFLSINLWNLKIGFSFIPIVQIDIADAYTPIVHGCRRDFA